MKPSKMRPATDAERDAYWKQKNARLKARSDGPVKWAEIHEAFLALTWNGVPGANIR